VILAQELFASEPKAAAFNFNLATGSGSGIVAAYLTRRCFLEIYLASRQKAKGIAINIHIIVIIVHIIIIIIIIATAVVDFGSWPFCQFQLNDAADFFW